MATSKNISDRKPFVTRLSSGLRVASVTMPEAATSSIAIWVNAGSRDEKPEEHGISHLLEHMLFKGTKKRTAQKIAEEFDAIGGYLNAYTSREQTVYYARVLKDHFDKAAELLSDMLLHSVIDRTELKREQDVIIQEIAGTYDTPDDIIFDYAQEVAYPKQPLGRTILGTEKSVASITRRQLFNYMEHHYVPEKMVVAIAGPLSHRKACETVRRFFKLKPSDPTIQKPRARYYGGDFRQKRNLEQLHLVLGFPSVSYHGPDYYTMQVLTTVLGGGMSSRLFQEIREKRGLAYSIQPSATNFEDSGYFTIYAGTSPEKGKELLKVVAGEIHKLIEKPVGAAELRRAKEQLRANLMMEHESTMNRAEELGRQIASYGKFISVEEMIENMNRVTSKQVSQMMERTISGGKLSFSAIGSVSNLPDHHRLTHWYSS